MALEPTDYTSGADSDVIVRPRSLREEEWPESTAAPKVSRTRARVRIALSNFAENPALRLLLLAIGAGLSFVLARAWEGGGLALPANLLSSWVGVAFVVQVFVAWGSALFGPLRKVTLRRLLARLALVSTIVPGTLLLVRFPLDGFAPGLASAVRQATAGFAALAFGFFVLQRMERRRCERILLLGLWSETEHFLSVLRTLPSHSRPVFPPDSPDLVVRNEPSLSQAERVLRETRPDRIYIVRNSVKEEEIFRVLEIAPEGVSVYVVPSVWDSVISRLALGPVLGDLRTFEICSPLTDPVSAAIKRAFDVLVSAVSLVVLAPLLGALAAIVRMDSPGPALYLQRRLGRRGRVFRIVKFRTMKVDAEAITGPVLAADGDSRVTRAGRWLRRFRLDEIPQLWNVLRGDMSLVGPRPERPEFAEEHREEIPGYELRHQVRPGITGMAQIYGRYRSHANEKIRFDLAYVYNHSFRLDLLLLLKTVWVVLTRQGH